MTNDLSKIIGKKLKEIRLQKQLNQEQFAEKLQFLDVSGYRKTENGTKDISLKKLNSILNILNITPYEFFLDEFFLESKQNNNSVNELIHLLSQQEDKEELIHLFQYILERKKS